MEPNLRDTPLRRFNTFWWGLALFGLFAVTAYSTRCIFHCNKTSSDPEDRRKVERIEIKRDVDTAQNAALNTYKAVEPGKTVQVKPEDVFGTKALQEQLLAQPTSTGVAHKKELK